MGYTILHNRQSEASRAFVASLPEDGGHTIIEWYTDALAVAEYLAGHPGLYPSDFPSVVIRVSDQTVAEGVDPLTGATVPAHVDAAHWVLLRCPADLAEVEAAVAAAGA